MTWVRTEDTMPLHPKILVLSDGAFRLWSNGLHHANRAVTDGKISKSLFASLNHHGRWTPKQMAGFVAELLAGLWVDCGDHYQIHDYAKHQAEAMKERVERKKELDREKQRQKRQRDEDKLRESLGMSPGDKPSESPPKSRRETPVPTRPDPTRPDLSPGGESARATPPPSPGVESMLRSLAPTPDRDAAVVALVSETRGIKFKPVAHVDRDAISRLGEWAADMPGGLEDLRRALVAFWAAKGTGARLVWLADDPAMWLGERAAPTTKPGAFRPCPPASEFRDDDSALVAWEREIAS